MTKIIKTDFKEKVRSVVCAIPKGYVLTYKDVALFAGFPGAARAVGTLMKNNFATQVPCHRVVRSDGKVGEYNRGGTKSKVNKLRAEGAYKSNASLRYWKPKINQIPK